ncbi:NAD(P)H-quinone oxidoreductase [Idiomarina sp.]|uniref:NAD(P)H-quinone oxidoreductase n=1 Tax=Idiomarina sp. TaxID=1874361 RepID=UPI0025C2E731|nr:NAD(P)H-quinone oxidoreductase [Idiomarina sp.]
MLAAQIKDGQIEWQTDADVQPQQLAADEVQIRIAFAGVNRADLMQVAGAYPPPAGASSVPGLECSGIVTAVGSDVTKLNIGDRVAALLAAGGYAESVIVSQHQVLTLPLSWSLAQGAAWLETFATAYLNVFMLAQLSTTDVVFAHAGASGVGSALIQLCREQGNPIYVTASGDDKCAFCETLGATKAINRQQQDYVEILKVHGGVDVILNPVAGDSIARDQKILNQDGRIILIGLMGGREGSVDFGRMLMKRQQLMGSTLRALPSARKGEILTAMWQQFAEAFSAGRVRPILDKQFDAREINDALAYLKGNNSQGKVVVKIAELEDSQN